jgi:DNA-binding response OmpR family regulator
MGELTARVREVLRRPGLGASGISGVIQVGDLKLDLECHMLWRGDDAIHLSPKEFDLFAFMMKNADVLLTHVKLLRYGGELEYPSRPRKHTRTARPQASERSA